MFYDAFLSLCDDKGVKPGRVADEIGINRATVTSWKKAGYTPRADQLSKISKYFDVPTDFLLGLQPFNNWETINANRKQFVDASGIDSKVFSVLWGIDKTSPETAPLVSFIKFVSEAIVSAEMNSDGLLEIAVKENFIGMTIGAQLKLGKKKPTPVSEDGLDERDRQLVELMKRLSADQKEFLLAQLLTLTGRDK